MNSILNIKNGLYILAALFIISCDEGKYILMTQWIQAGQPLLPSPSTDWEHGLKRIIFHWLPSEKTAQQSH